VRPTFTQGVNAGIHDICRCIEIGLADLQMNNAFARLFQSPRFVQYFKRGLSTAATCAEPAAIRTA